MVAVIARLVVISIARVVVISMARVVVITLVLARLACAAVIDINKNLKPVLAWGIRADAP